MTSHERETVITCICAWCKVLLGVVRSPWIGVESAETHGICAACFRRLEEIDSRSRTAGRAV